MTVAEVIVWHDATDARFVILRGPGGRPIPTRVRTTVKAPPYLGDFLHELRGWRVTSAAAERLMIELEREGWAIEHVTVPTDPPDAQTIWECQLCGQPYRPGATTPDGLCAGCSKPLRVVPPPK